MNEPHDPDRTVAVPSTPADSLDAGLAAGFGRPGQAPRSSLEASQRPVLQAENVAAAEEDDALKLILDCNSWGELPVSLRVGQNDSIVAERPISFTSADVYMDGGTGTATLGGPGLITTSLMHWHLTGTCVVAGGVVVKGGTFDMAPQAVLAVRGREEPIAVFEPWPSDAPPSWRDAYLAAYAMLDCDAANATALLQKLMVERPADMAMRGLAKRLPPTSKSNLSSAPPADEKTE